MQTYEYTFSAGETKVFPSGQFFILIDASSGVDVDYFKNNTNINESASGVTSGYFYRNENGFDTVQVTSATGQTVKLAISKAGDGGYNIASQIISGGTVDLINEITPQTSGITSYHRLNTSDALNTIVTPASNTNGILVTAISTYSDTCFVRVMFNTTSPTGYLDGVNIGPQVYTPSTDSVNRYFAQCAMPIIVPAGYGLYERSNSNTNTSGADVTYTVL